MTAPTKASEALSAEESVREIADAYGIDMGLDEILAFVEAMEAHAAAAVAREREKWEALDDENADTVEAIDSILPHWNHVHASGEEEEQSLIERAESTARDARREKARAEQAEARLATTSAVVDDYVKANIALIDERDALTARLAKMSEKLEELRDARDRQRRRTREVERERDASNTQLGEVERERSGLKDMVTVARRERDEARAENERLRAALERARIQVCEVMERPNDHMSSIRLMGVNAHIDVALLNGPSAGAEGGQ